VVPTSTKTGETFSFNRSGYLAEYGFEGGPVWFAPEETGPDGRGWAVTPDGTAQASRAGSLLQREMLQLPVSG